MLILIRKLRLKEIQLPYSVELELQLMHPKSGPVIRTHYKVITTLPLEYWLQPALQKVITLSLFLPQLLCLHHCNAI